MRVLIADDDPVTRRHLEAALAGFGYEVESCADGAEACLHLTRADGPRLAILDWVMPGVDGLEVVRTVRGAGLPIAPYLIVLTAIRGDTSDVRTALDAGADDHVRKPFDPGELLARVRAGQRVVELQERLAARVQQLEGALARVRQLQELLPICIYCRQVRDDRSYWQKLETYLAEHSGTRFSHGICPACFADKVRPELDQLAPPDERPTA